MGGPIVRTGATPKFWENWDRVFGADAKKKAKKKTSKPKSRKSKKSKS